MLNVAGQLATALQTHAQAGVPPAPSVPVASRAPDGTFQVADDNYITGADFNRVAPQLARQYFNETVKPQIDALTQMAYQTALEQVKRERPEIFAKYGPTIYANLAAVDDKRSLTVDNIRKLVNYSLADHVDDIAREKAGLIAAEMVGTLRSNGAASPPVAANPDLTLQSEKLPADYRKKLQDFGIDERSLDEFCAAQSITRQQFFAQFERRGIITEVSQKKSGD